MPIPTLALKQLQHKSNRKHNPDNHSNRESTNTGNNTNKNNRNITIVVPYIQSIDKRFKKACQSKGIQVHFKGTNTLRTPLVKSKDKDSKMQKSGVIYNFRHSHINSSEAYTGESGRAFGDRIKEHLKAPSLIDHHSNTTGHPVSPDCFNIIDSEARGTSRNIKEGMFIRVNVPSLNRNLGKYQLLHIWDNILQDT